MLQTNQKRSPFPRAPKRGALILFATAINRNYYPGNISLRLNSLPFFFFFEFYIEISFQLILVRRDKLREIDFSRIWNDIESRIIDATN